MNNTQSKYIFNKIEKHVDEEESRLRDKYPHRDGYSRDEKIALILDGQAKLKSSDEIALTLSKNHYADLTQAYTYFDVSFIDKLEFNKRIKKLRSEADKLKDHIMLGDEQAAMARLSAFIAKEL